MLTASLSVTMAACATASGGKPAAGAAPDPVIERQVETRLVCPSALGRALPADPELKAGAVIRHNDAGGEYLDGRMARGEAAEQIVTDARAECQEKGALF